MMKHSILAILLSSLALTACAQTKNEPSVDKNTKTQNDPEIQKKVQQSVEKTKKNMIFVEGGTFMMGDFGHLSRKDKLPISGLYAAMPTHQVTLDNFSLNAYKTTFDEKTVGAVRVNNWEEAYEEICRIDRERKETLKPEGNA